MKWTAVFTAMAITGTTVVQIIMIGAMAGAVIGVLNITGLGFALTHSLVQMAGGNLDLVLVMAALGHFSVDFFAGLLPVLLAQFLLNGQGEIFHGFPRGGPDEQGGDVAVHRADAELYRKLATLRADVPLTESLEDLRWRGADTGALEALGFGDLADRAHSLATQRE